MKKILILNEAFNCDLIEATLLDNISNYELISSQCGLDSLKSIEVENFDLIITTFSIDGITAIDILDKIKKLKLDTPVVVVSAVDKELESLSSGAFDFILEPYNIEILRLRIEKVFN